MSRVRYADRESSEAQERVQDRLRQGGVLLNGYHFCTSCERVTEPLDRPTGRVCCFCHSVRLRYVPKVDLQEPTQAQERQDAIFVANLTSIR